MHMQYCCQLPRTTADSFVAALGDAGMMARSLLAALLPALLVLLLIRIVSVLKWVKVDWRWQCSSKDKCN
jgi:hypothetical protein